MRKVCIVVASRANYGRIKSVVEAVAEHSDLELQLIVGASTLLDRFGRCVDIIRSDGFSPVRELYYIVEGETLSTQAKSVGLGILELTSAFEEIKPDLVLSVADRFETMSTALAATYLNIPLVHVQGGEVSGNIDDRVRHAITKLADYHYVASAESEQRVLKMGEERSRVFNYGCPAMDVAHKADKTINNDVMEKYNGVGCNIDWSKKYILMIQHPVTTSYGQGREQIEATLNALQDFPEYQKVVLWPNADAGSDDVSKGIRIFRENNSSSNFGYFKNFSAEDFIRVLANASVAVGNSSAFLREGCFLGVPGVIVGDRQRGREIGENIKFADYNSANITSVIKEQLLVGKFEPGRIFGVGNAGKSIAESLAVVPLGEIKTNSY